MSAVPLPEPDAWRSQSPVGGYHFSETRPTGAVEKYPQTPLVTLEDAIVYGAACAAEADKRWEDALSQTWRMVDPFNPAGTPGSYARGQDSGIVAALTTLRANLKAAAIRASATRGPMPHAEPDKPRTVQSPAFPTEAP